MLGSLFPVFYLNDDVTMRSIMSGAYTGTPQPHVVYMKYPLSLFLSLCYSVADFIPWMEIFFLACIVLCGCIILGDWKKQSAWERGILLAIVCAFCLPQCFYMHYTIIAALLIACGIWSYVRGQAGWRLIVCALLSYLVRSQVFYVALPFIFVAVLWKGYAPMRDKRKHFLGLVVLLIACGLCHRVAYMSDEWQSYNRYNEVRTQLYDYTDFLSTDMYRNNPEEYGMTASQYDVLSSYNLLLDEEIDAQILDRVGKNIICGMEEGRDWLEYLGTCLRSYYNYVRYDDMIKHVALFVLYTLLLVMVVREKHWWKAGIVFALAVGRSIIWVYLIWKGRFPERVRESLLIIEIALILGCLLSENVKDRFAGVRNGIMLGALLGLFVFIGYRTVENVRQVNENQVQWDMLVDYCESNPEQTFLMDVFSVASYSGCVFEKDASNMFILGGWLAGSPIAKDKLETAVRPCLIVRSDRSYEWMEEYFAKKYGAGEFTSTPIEIIANDVVFYAVEYVQVP